MCAASITALSSSCSFCLCFFFFSRKLHTPAPYRTDGAVMSFHWGYIDTAGVLIRPRRPGYLDIIGGQACRRVRGRPTISVSILLLAGATDMYASVHHHTPPSTFNCGSAETMRVLAICSFVPSRQIGSGSARCRRGFAEIGRPESELSIMAELSAITLLHSSAARR